MFDRCRARLVLVALVLVAAVIVQSDAWMAAADETPPAAPQYQFETLVIPAASIDEPTRGEFSLAKAEHYLRDGAIAWSKQRKCVSCHTNGVYLLSRPELTPFLGRPDPEMRTFFIEQRVTLQETDRKRLTSGVRPTQVAYIAAGLAEWDAHVEQKLTPETEDALKLMFDVQGADGSWKNVDCWPPFESGVYHSTTVAAMAAATAPSWLDGLSDPSLKAGVVKMKNYLRTTPPPHDYDRLLLLWTSTRLPGLVDKQQQQELIEMIWKHQREDGGWSIRTFAAPEDWGRGNRAEKLRSEPEFDSPPSDGHQTGLAIIVLRDAGVPADDPRIQKGIEWLLANQRESGRWWTRSLNTDKFHYITYSGTCYPLMALARCGKLPALPQ